MEEYSSAFAREIQAKNSGEDKEPLTIIGSYESRHAIAGQIAGIAEEMKGICDFLGEALNFPSSIIYDNSEAGAKMRRMEDILCSYAKNPALEISLRRESEQAMNLIKKVSQINPGESISKEQSLREILETYSYFDELSGKDSRGGVDISAIVSEIAPCCLKTQRIWADNLKNESAYATQSVGIALEKIASFISDYSKEGSTLSFSSKKYEHSLEITASGSKTKIERASKEIIGEDWRLVLAEYIAEKNNSYITIEKSRPYAIEIKIALPIDNAPMVHEFRAKESMYEDALSSIQKRISEEDLSGIRQACEENKHAMNIYSSAGDEEKAYLRTMGFQRMLDSYSGILSRAKKYTAINADSLASEIGQMRSELKSATAMSCMMRGGIDNFKKRTAEGIQEKTQELSRTIRLIKLLEF
jgi:hypothetical protein